MSTSSRALVRFAPCVGRPTPFDGLIGTRRPHKGRLVREMNCAGTVLCCTGKEWVTRGRFRRPQVKKDAVKALCRRTISTWHMFTYPLSVHPSAPPPLSRTRASLSSFHFCVRLVPNNTGGEVVYIVRRPRSTLPCRSIIAMNLFNSSV